jgi:hypothetical protein
LGDKYRPYNKEIMNIKGKILEVKDTVQVTESFKKKGIYP